MVIPVNRAWNILVHALEPLLQFDGNARWRETSLPAHLMPGGISYGAESRG